MAWARRRARRRLRPGGRPRSCRLGGGGVRRAGPRPPSKRRSNQAATLLQSLPPASAAGAARRWRCCRHRAHRKARRPGRSSFAARRRRRPPASAPPAAAGDADITLNFSGADIRDVVASVLGETLKLNYVIDPDVAGPITFNVSRPLRRDEVLPALEAVLESRGITMVQSDGIVRVMMARADGKPHSAVPIGTAAGRGRRAHRGDSRCAMSPHRTCSACCEKVLPPGKVMLADEAHRLLLVQGTGDELRIAEDTVAHLRCRRAERQVDSAAAAGECRGGDGRGRAAEHLRRDAQGRRRRRRSASCRWSGSMPSWC